MRPSNRIDTPDRSRERLSLSAAVALALLAAAPGASYNICSDPNRPCTHENMTQQARDLFSSQFETSHIARELFEFYHLIERGVANPDEYDPVYGNTGVGDGLVTASHFWSPDGNLGAPMIIRDVGPIDIGPFGGDYPNAINAALGLWNRALGEYAAGNKEGAYQFLGMVAHFLEDQTIPTHAHNVIHGPDAIVDDAYEEWMSAGSDGRSPNAFLSSEEWRRVRGEGVLETSLNEIDDQFLWIFLTTNQVADYFASDQVDGDSRPVNDPNYTWVDERFAGDVASVAAACFLEPRGCPTDADRLADNDAIGPCGFGPCNNDNDGDLSLIRKYSYVRGIRAVAGLFALWEKAVTRPILTVTVRRVKEVGRDDGDFGVFGMDGYQDPDYYVGMVMGYARRNCVDGDCPRPVGAYLENHQGQLRNVGGEVFPGSVTRYDSFQHHSTVNWKTFDKVRRGSENQTEIRPGYVFSQTYNYRRGSEDYISGQDVVDLYITVWDNDEFFEPFEAPYSVDDPADIKNTDGLELHLVVDLAKCLSGAAGGVSAPGIRSAACPTNLTFQGRGDDPNDVLIDLNVRMFIPPRPPVADAGGPYSVPEGGEVTLSGAGSRDPDQDAATLTYEWDLGEEKGDDDIEFETLGIEVEFSAAEIDGPDSRVVRLRVTDATDLIDIDEATIEIFNVPPSVSIEALRDEAGNTIGGEIEVALVGVPIEFDGVFTDPGVFDTHVAVIDWGDGSMSTHPDATRPGRPSPVVEQHVYEQTGEHEIEFTVTDDDMGVGAAKRVLEVVDAAGAVAHTMENLVRFARAPHQDPAAAELVESALVELNGGRRRRDAPGALALARAGRWDEAMARMSRAIELLEEADAASAEDLSPAYGLLAVAVKSIVVEAVEVARADATTTFELREIAQVEARIAAGDALLAERLARAAVEEYRAALGMLPHVGAAGPGPTDLDRSRASRFEPVATFAMSQNLCDRPDCPPAAASVEAVAVSADGNTALYSDPDNAAVGLIDITDPADPRPAGLVPVGGTPRGLAAIGGYAIAASDTGADSLSEAGELAILNLATKAVVRRIPLGGQPGPLAASRTGRYVAVVIENGRRQGLCLGGLLSGYELEADVCEDAGGRLAGPPQPPPGELVILDAAGPPALWSLRRVALTGLAQVHGDDPEPRFVDVNAHDVAIVSLPANRHVVLVRLSDGALVSHFPMDGLEPSAEPGSLAWLAPLEAAVSAASDDGAAFRIVDARGRTRYDSADTAEQRALQAPRDETDAADDRLHLSFGLYGNRRLLFAAYRSSRVVAVFRVAGDGSLELVQALPTGPEPQRLLAVPSKGLLLAAQQGAAAQPEITIYRLE